MNIDLINGDSVFGVGANVAVILGAIAISLIFIFRDNTPHKWKIVSFMLVIILVGGGVLWYTLNTNSQAKTWTAALQEFAPSCDPASNGVWVVPQQARSSTHIDCPREGSLVTASTAPLAEITLDRVNQQSYGQTKLDVQVQVTFKQDPDPDTLAGLLVQTQQGAGGYGLWINNTGYWLLEDNNGNMKASSGRITARTIFTIEMKVQQGKLYGLLTNEKGELQQVLVYDDTINPGAVGLAVYEGGTSPSPVLFSDFELKV